VAARATAGGTAELALFRSSVLNGFLAPALLAVLMLVASRRSIMGDRVNGRGLNVAGSNVG
jgi:Mn2+/Fe2+ NRAMP family transporter